MAPFKSHAQRQHFIAKVKAGQMTKEEFDKWHEGTPAQLPERVTPLAKAIKQIKPIKALK